VILEKDLGKRKNKKNRKEKKGRKEEKEFEAERQGLINSLNEFGISKPVLAAMLRVPRQEFVPPFLREVAYVDTPLEIGYNQTISAPHMVAIMCELLELAEGQKVLEIGAGSGYNAAVMAELLGKGKKKGQIYSIERLKPLFEFAKANLKRTGYKNVTLLLEDGSLGAPAFAPFDRIAVTCTAPKVPKPLLEQLKPGGLMVIPIGDYFQELVLIKKDKNGRISREGKGRVVFVPLIGKYGFKNA